VEDLQEQSTDGSPEQGPDTESAKTYALRGVVLGVRPIAEADEETVKTTIVGGRPPAPGRQQGSIPRGIEVLIKKASVDPEFRDLLLEKRAEAAHEIGLELSPAEVAAINAVPAAQLEQVIANTRVPPN
jgi:hypothetical protein